MNFKELGLNETLLAGLEAMKFEKATPIQEKAIPVIIEGRDLIACAQTGTGKTAAFLLPVLNEDRDLESNSIDTLILVPTRELAVQIDQQLEGFAYFTPLSSIPIYGGRDGQSFDREKKALTQGANVIVATPGRLIQHLNFGYVKVDKLKHLILDEADRMLDMGFQEDLQKIISYLPKKRQTLMFSATMAPKIRNFAKRILHNPIEISLAISKPAAGIIQAAYEAEDEVKAELLSYLLSGRKDKEERILVFSSTKAGVKDIVSILKTTNLPTGEIHSNLDQKEREEILRGFKSGNINVLVATDILSRGIDVKNINLVVNYNVPGDAEDYIHRVGRTARAESDGVALTLINRRDRRKFKAIEDLMEMEVKKLPLPPHLKEKQEAALKSSNRRKNHRDSRGGGRSGHRRKSPGRGRRHGKHKN